MPRAAKLILGGLLIAMAGLFAVGFLATFEPPGWLAMRAAYAIAGIACLALAVFLIRGARKGRRRGFPVETHQPDRNEAP